MVTEKSDIPDFSEETKQALIKQEEDRKKKIRKILKIRNEDSTHIFEMGVAQEVANEEVRLFLDEGSVGDKFYMELIEMIQGELDKIPEG